MAFRALSDVALSRDSPTEKRKRVTAPSAYSPMAMAPTAATTMSTFMSSVCASMMETHAARASGYPLTAMDSTRSRRDNHSAPPSQLTESAVTSSTPDPPVRSNSRCRADQPGRCPSAFLSPPGSARWKPICSVRARSGGITAVPRVDCTVSVPVA